MIRRIFNKLQVKEKRRRLRNEMTRAECELWKYLRRRNLRGYKFRRQFSIDIYIIDFYCPQLKLAVEVDGDTHLLMKKLNMIKKTKTY